MLIVYCCVLNVMLHTSLPTTKETLYLMYDSLILKPGSGGSVSLRIMIMHVGVGNVALRFAIRCCSRMSVS